MKPQRQTTTQQEKNPTTSSAELNSVVPLATAASPVLADPVAARGRLQVVLGVEVAVDENDRVSGGQVQADPPCKETAE